jgi:cytochrome c
VRRPAAIIVLAAATVVVLGLIHPFGNPRTERRAGLDTLLAHAKMPAEAKKILIDKCADCHSNETRWPVYARLAPGSWLIERDIVEARRKMNLSHWDGMSAEAQETMVGEIAHEAKSGEMPPLQYRLLHWESRLSPAEVAALTSMQTSAASQAVTNNPGDAGRGKTVFEKRCTGCHAMEKEREGPPLAGVFGRKAGSVAGFDYSAGLKKSGLTWDETTLERWLTDPDMIVPDNKMGIGLAASRDRSDLIAYLVHYK